MTKFRKQEKPYSCGASAIKNCLIALDRIDISERRIRLLSKTTAEGTDEVGLAKAIERLGYVPELFETKTEDVFKKHLIDGLKAGSMFIVLTDSGNHWVALVSYRNKYFEFVDSDFKRKLQTATCKDFLLVAKNIDKFRKKEIYFAVKISRVES